MSYHCPSNRNPANVFKQSILIHSATGGVGLAAIQLCKYLGVEVSRSLQASHLIWPLTPCTDLRDRRHK
jgi:NADPH:quinone reductase-like Zn-dependent oxidoreductase